MSQEIPMFKMLQSRPPVSLLCVAVLTTTILGSTPAPLQAQSVATSPGKLTLAQFVEERGGTARINLSAKLRMLSQRIPAAACVYSAHGNDDLAKAGLTAALEEFDQIVKGLEFGDESLGILGAEDSIKALKGLHILAEEWAPMNAAATALLESGGNDADALSQIYGQEAKVLKVTQKLAVEIGALYTDANSLTIGSAMAIDIAGRQRMLLQKMTKEACQISTGAGTADTSAALQKTVDTFDTTLTAMIDGMPEAGMPPAPTPEIRAAIEAVRTEWLAARAAVDGVIGGANLDPAGLAALMATHDALMKAMNQIVTDYAASATF
jgi:hypothetical protein